MLVFKTVVELELRQTGSSTAVLVSASTENLAETTQSEYCLSRPYAICSTAVSLQILTSIPWPWIGNFLDVHNLDSNATAGLWVFWCIFCLKLISQTAGNLSKWLGNYMLFAAHHVVMNSFSIFLNVTDGYKRGPRMRQTHYRCRLEGRGGIPLTVKVSLCSADLNYSQTFLTDVFGGNTNQIGCGCTVA